MFDNISGKIKSFAVISTIIGIIISIITGFMLMSEFFFIGLLVIVLGSLIAWVSSFAFYGFGEIIEQLEAQNNYAHQLCQLLKTIAPEEDKKSEPQKSYSLSQLAKETKGTKETTKATDFWYCKECHTKNASNSIYCKNCGKYK